MFVAGLALFTLASVACALSGNIAALIAARAAQGAAAALVMPLAMALLSTAFPPDRRARALGIFGAVTGLAVLGGPVGGGLVVEGLAWQWIFWLNIPLGMVLIPLVLRHVPESFGADARFDFCGVALISAGALGICLGPDARQSRRLDQRRSAGLTGRGRDPDAGLCALGQSRRSADGGAIAGLALPARHSVAVAERPASP